MLSDPERRLVRWDVNLNRRRTQDANCIQGLIHILPGHPHFVAGDGNELIQHLQADHAAGRQECFGPNSPRIVIRRRRDSARALRANPSLSPDQQAHYLDVVLQEHEHLAEMISAMLDQAYQPERSKHA